jgi:uncharacterized protein (DUF697 family)
VNNNHVSRKMEFGGAVGSRLRCYELALGDPFNLSAIGAQVPDMYSAPTCTYHSQGTMTIGSNATGVASILLSPIPYATLVDMTNTSTVSSGMVVTVPNIYGATSAANLANVFSSYRVVGCGFRLRNLLPPTVATGRVIVAPAIICGMVPGTTLLNASAPSSSAFTQLIMGNSPGGPGAPFSSDILESPGAEEYTIQDIITNTIEFNCKVLTPQCFNFTNATSTGTYNSTTSVGTEVLVDNSGETVAAVDNGGFDCVGWQAFAITMIGLPVSTVACVELEYIIHYEGVPVYTSGPGTIVPATPASPHINIGGHQSALSAVLSRPAIRIISEVGKSAFNGMKSGGMAGAGANLLSLMMAKMGLQL